MYIGSQSWRASLSESEKVRLESFLEKLASDPFLRRVAEASVDFMSIDFGDRVLDVGCGSGVLLPLLAGIVGPGGRVVGLDYSGQFLGAAGIRVQEAGVADRVELVEGDAARLPFADGSFHSAHVERVLMHLEDADAAIREMRRVVRPGGWVVAAEPDSLGVRVDHPRDPDAMALIAALDVQSFRNPGIGLELNRRFAEAGLVDRRIVPMADFDGTYDPVAAEGDRKAAAMLVAEGRLAAERAEATIAYLEAAAARGEFSWLGTMVIAAGRVPPSDG